MTEAQVGHLYNISSLMASTDPSSTLLKSYYMMRCKDLTRGYGLPEKQFSTKIRCPHCCLEWKKGSDLKVRSIKLSKRQKKRIRHIKIKGHSHEYVDKKKQLVHSNQMEQICSFCKHSTVTTLLKPNKQEIKNKSVDSQTKVVVPDQKNVQTLKKKKSQTVVQKEPVTNVYSSAFDVFSLKNKNNTIASSVKVEPKLIKNNKKKKDKFAGLCQQAVLASAKLKEQKDKQNKLNLFLKPSK